MQTKNKATEDEKGVQIRSDSRTQGNSPVANTNTSSLLYAKRICY